MEEMDGSFPKPPAIPDEMKTVSSLVSKLRPFICDLCDMRFDEKTHLRQHIGHRHLAKDKKCPDCDVMINSISIVSHQQIHRKKHICEKCGRLFQTAKRLEAHMGKFCLSKTREVLERDPEFLAKKFKCIMCVYRGPNERALNKHVQRVHRAKHMEKEKTCEICHKQFNKIAYTYHVRTHGRIQCEKCHKWLSTGSGFFKQHMLNHEKEEEEAQDPKSHQKALGADGIFRCYGDGCDYETHKKRLFVRHWQNKHGPKLLKCDHPGCDSGLMSEKQLWRHKNTHKRKDCENCGAVFNDLRDLNRHKAKNICKNIEVKNTEVTTDPTSSPFQPIHDLKCEKCDYTTYQANALIRHRLHYHAPLVGRCTYPDCQNKEMMTKAKLTVHMKRHREYAERNRKKCPCEFCGLELSNSSNLRRHLTCCKDKPQTNGESSEVVGIKDEKNVSDENDEESTEDQEIEVKPLNGTIQLTNERVLKFKLVEIKAVCNYCDERFSKTDLNDHIKSCSRRSNLKTNDLPQAATVKLEPGVETSSSEVHKETNNDAITPQIHIKLEPEVEIREENEEKMVKLESFDQHDTNLSLNGSDDPLTDSDDSGSDTDGSELPFKCKKCDFRTDKQKYLRKHMASKHDPNPIKCPDCDRFFSRPSYNKHRQTHTREFECYMCEKNFATKWKLKTHILKRHPEIANIIEDTDITLPSNGLLELTEDQLTCRKCNHQSSDIHELRCHLRDHEPVKVNTPEYQCEKCDYTSYKRKNLNYHMIMVHDPKPKECPACMKKISKARFKKHMQTHTLDFACSLCSKRTSTRWNLKEHINKNHPGRQDLIDEINEQGRIRKLERCNIQPIQIQCDHCDYTADDRRNFINHFSRMHATTRCTCQYCGHTVSRIDYKRHLATHENPAAKTFTFMCEKCSRVFAQKRSLEVHTLSCTGQIRVPTSQEFKCGVCDFATGTKKSLRNHNYMVHAPKNSQCPICQKMMTKAKLSGHIRWHENRLTCTLCQKDNFASRWHLKVHILKVHPGNEQLMADEGLFKEMTPSVTEGGKGGKEVECPDCGKLVKELRMSTHALIHNKKFHCTHEGCAKVFANRYALKAHSSRCKNRIKEEPISNEGTN